jgi:hypothetical protein
VDLSDMNLLARHPLHGARAPRSTLTREHAEAAVATAEGIARYATRMPGDTEAGHPSEPQ